VAKKLLLEALKGTDGLQVVPEALKSTRTRLMDVVKGRGRVEGTAVGVAAAVGAVGTGLARPMQAPGGRVNDEERARQRVLALKPPDTFRPHMGPVFALKSQTYSIGSAAALTRGCTFATFTHYREVMCRLDLNRNFDVHRGPGSQVTHHTPVSVSQPASHPPLTHSQHAHVHVHVHVHVHTLTHSHTHTHTHSH
jgi:hypothetical protein